MSKLFWSLWGAVAVGALLTLFIILGNHFLTNREPEVQGVQYGDKVCIDGGGWFLGGMPLPEPFLVCGELQEFEPVPPIDEEHNLEDESRRGA